MKASTLRLAFPLLSCALLLTACPGPRPVPIDLASDPSALNGTWSGQLGSAITSGQAVLGGEFLYVLQAERVGYTYGVDSGFRSAESIVMLDAATGVEVRRVPSLGVSELRLRPASPGFPARLMALGQAPFVPGMSGNAGMILLELDPVTLEERRRTPLPWQEYGHRLNADGSWVLVNNAGPLDTRTGQPVVLPTAVQEQLGQSQNPTQRFVFWTASGAYLSVGGRTSTAPQSPWVTRLYSAATGAVFEGAARHATACPGQYSLESPNDTAELPGGGVALAYSDGTVELRRPDDTLRQLVNLGDCSPPTLRRDADILTFTLEHGTSFGTLRVSDGQILARKAVERQNVHAVGEGTVVTTGYQAGPFAALRLERTSGTVWQLQNKMHTLKLEARITSVTRNEYTSVGTATLDGESLTFAVKAKSGSYEFKPQSLGAQSSPPIPVHWAGDLRRSDGTVVAKIGGLHSSQLPSQMVQLEFPDLDREFAFVGTLGR